MAQTYSLPTQRYAGRLIVELDPNVNWTAVTPALPVILASDGTAWLDMARVPVPGGGTENRILSVEATDGADEPVASLRAVLQMRTDAGGSLSDSAVTDTINNLPGTVSPAIFAGRRIIWQDPLGDLDSEDPTDWAPRFWGYLQDPRVNAAGNLQLFAVDAASRLQVPYTGPAVRIGVEGEALPLDEAIQQGLDAAFGAGVWALKSPPGDLEWAVPSHEMADVANMLEWARNAAQQRGATVRWWPDEDTGRYQLSLIVLQQEKAEPDHTFTPGETTDIPSHGSDLANYRNDFRLAYLDSATGKVEEIHRPATEGEKRAFGLKPQKITEASTSLIDTAAEAESFLDTVEAALRQPAVVGSRVLHTWAADIQINSLLRFTADGRVLQAPIDGYVVRWTKRMAMRGARFERSITVEYRAAPVGQIKAWLRSFGAGTDAPEPPEYDFQLRNVIWTDGDPNGSLSWESGPRVEETWVGSVLVEAPITQAKWQIAADAIAPATSPLSLPMPTERSGVARIRLIHMQAMVTGADGSLEPSDVYRKAVYPRTSIPAIDDETGELADGSVKRAEMIADGILTGQMMREGAQKFNTSVTFSATDHNTVAWSSGTIRLASGASYSVAAGSTGNMTAPTWIYLDTAISTSVLQTTTNIGLTVGDSRLILCYARPIADTSQFAMYIPAVGLFGLNSDALHASSVTALHISSISLSVLQATVNQLSALSADIGEVYTGLILNDAPANDPTRAIRLSDDSIPASVVDFIDLSPDELTDPVVQIGGLQILANGDTIVADEVEKVAVISHYALVEDSVGANLIRSPATVQIIDAAPASSVLGARVPVPVGATITALRVTGRLEAVGNVCSARLIRVEDKGTGTIDVLGTAAIFDTSAQTVQTFITPRDVAADEAYVVDATLERNSGASPALYSVEVVYTSHNYRQTL